MKVLVLNNPDHALAMPRSVPGVRTPSGIRWDGDVLTGRHSVSQALQRAKTRRHSLSHDREETLRWLDRRIP